MLNTYIKNVGSSQTTIGNRCQNHMEKVDWNADYDGNKAKIFIKKNIDGNKQKYHFTLDNADLANLLNINSVNMPIHKRLKTDFKKPIFIHEPNLYRIELPTPELVPRISSDFSDSSDFSESSDFSNFSESPDSLSDSLSDSSISKLIKSSPNSFLSSPSSDEEFIVPVTLKPRSYKKYTFTPKKRNLTLKTHKTYRVFRRPKSSRRKHQRRRSTRR